MRVAVTPDSLEAVANHPRVRPWLGGSNERVEAGETWAITKALEWDSQGGVVFMDEGGSVYSAHLVFARKTRGILDKCSQAVEWLFAHGGAAIVADIPKPHRHVRAVALALGMKERGGRWWLTAQEHKERAQ